MTGFACEEGIVFYYSELPNDDVDNGIAAYNRNRGNRIVEVCGGVVVAACQRPRSRDE